MSDNTGARLSALEATVIGLEMRVTQLLRTVEDTERLDAATALLYALYHLPADAYATGTPLAKQSVSVALARAQRAFNVGGGRK